MFPPSLSLDELKAIDLTNHPHSIDHHSEQYEESKDDWPGVSEAEEEDEYDLEEEEDVQEEPGASPIADHQRPDDAQRNEDVGYGQHRRSEGTAVIHAATRAAHFGC